MLDRAFLYLYAALNSPKRTDIFDTVAFALAYGISTHASVCALVIYEYGYHKKIEPFIKWTVSGAFLLIFASFFFIYVIRGRGQYLIRTFSAELRLKQTKTIGLAIATWIFAFPFLIIIAFFVHYRLR